MSIYQGTYYAKGFLMKNKSDHSAVDISGWTFEAQFRDRVDSDVLLTLTTADGGFEVTDGPLGAFEMRITADQTTELPVLKMVFDVLRTDLAPGPRWMFSGKVPVKRPVTRDE